MKQARDALDQEKNEKQSCMHWIREMPAFFARHSHHDDLEFVRSKFWRRRRAHRHLAWYRSERNAISGGTFTVNFEFQFAADGTFRQTASLGSLAILRLTGQYSLVPGRRPGDPSVTHILTLAPRNVEVKPSQDELRLLMMADLPNLEGTQQYVQFFNLAPAGGMTLNNVASGGGWGLKKI